MKKLTRLLGLIPEALIVLLLGTPVFHWLRCLWPAFPGWIFWPVATLLLASVMISYMLPYGRLSSALHFIGEAMMPVNLLAGALIVPAEVLGLFWKKMPLREAGFVLLVLFILLTAAGLWNAFRIKTATYRIQTEKCCAPVRLALLSDLHLGAFTGRRMTKRIADAVCAQAPDLVILAGDLFDDRLEDLRHSDAHSAELRRMAEHCPVLACEGNHDLFEPTPEREAFLEKAGIRLLQDERRTEKGINFVFRRDIRVRERRSAEELLTGIRDDGFPVVAVDHNPAEEKALWKAGADLVLSGHTHGGQSFPGDWLFKMTGGHCYGLKSDGIHAAIVTSGAGFYGIPLRLGVNTEIAVVEICGKDRQDETVH